MGPQKDNDSKHTTKLVTKRLQDNKVNVLQWPSQRPDLSPVEHLWAVEQETYKPDSVPLPLSGGMNQNSENYCEKLLEGNPQHLTQIRPLKDNDTRY